MYWPVKHLKLGPDCRNAVKALNVHVFFCSYVPIFRVHTANPILDSPNAMACDLRLRNSQVIHLEEFGLLTFSSVLPRISDGISLCDKGNRRMRTPLSLCRLVVVHLTM